MEQPKGRGIQALSFTREYKQVEKKDLKSSSSIFFQWKMPLTLHIIVSIEICPAFRNTDSVFVD